MACRVSGRACLIKRQGKGGGFVVFDLVIKNACVVRKSGVRQLDVAIRNGKIVALANVGEELPAKETIDAEGMLLLPGLIDLHVHGGHGDPERETLQKVSMAAAAGGITTIVDQPLSNPSTVTVEQLLAKERAAERECVVDFSLWGGLVPGHLDDLKPMYEFGAKAFKSFMCRCSNYPMIDDGLLLKGMRLVGELGGMVAVHAESDTLIGQLVDDYRAAGRNDVRAFIESHPEYSELEAIERFLFLLQQAPSCQGHIVHLSIADGAKAVKRARAEGLDNITVETSPQYLGLCEDDLYAIGGVAKCDPPLRANETVDALWNYVLDGTIDIIASDHSPHEFKKKANRDFWSVPEGVTGVQTLLPVVVTEGRKRGLTWERLAALCSENPAKLFRIYGNKGAIEVGFDADLVFFDPKLDWVLRAEDLFYHNQHSPFIGRQFHGKVMKTLVRGVVVYDDHCITVQPGFGRYYKMQ